MIRAADTPVRPGGRARPANPGPVGAAARSAVNEPDDAHAYRDTSEYRDTGEYRDTSEPDAAPRPGADERDASYWYDLSGADNPPGTHELAETRGPFEPLVSSSDPQRRTPAPDSSATQAPPEGNPARTSQIRETYQTPEAVGEQNVGKHFDQLLAQPRELIGDYFKPPAAGAGHDGAVTPDHPGVPGPAGGEPDATHGAGAVAEPPRVW